jgi:hypothetical protein
VTDEEYDRALLSRDPFTTQASRMGVRNVPVPANQPLENEYYRALIGQGLGMGWGDEAEAWLRSKLPGGRSYEEEVADLRRRYAEFQERNPVGANVAEFVGGALPTAASLLATPFTGGAAAPVAAATTARTAGTLGRLAGQYGRTGAIGGATGAVTGAGVADEGDRLNEALVTGVLGTGVGVLAPAVIKGGAGVVKMARDALAKGDEDTARVASERINQVLQRSGMTPAEAEARILADQAQGIPTSLANLDPKMAAALERAAVRGEGTERIVVEELAPRLERSRQRGAVQTQQRLGAGNLFKAEEDIARELRRNADSNYRAAYAAGDVDDDVVRQMLDTPDIRSAYKNVQDLVRSDARGARSDALMYGTAFNPDDFVVRQFGEIPDVRTIDYLKRALDGKINSLYSSTTDPTASARAKGLEKIRNNLRDRTKEIVPAYREALERYAGDIEVKQALRTGFEDFQKLPREEIERMFTRPPSAGGMSDAEKEAFITGVNRFLYGQIMNAPAGQNAVARLIRSPEMGEKLRPMFPSNSHYEMFKSALEREGQLFEQGTNALKAAVQGGRLRAAGDIDSNSQLGQLLGDFLTQSNRGSLTSLAARAARSASISEEAAERITRMLISSKPEEVSAAVRLLENYGERSAGRERTLRQLQTGATTGAATSMLPRRQPPEDVDVLGR